MNRRTAIKAFAFGTCGLWLPKAFGDTRRILLLDKKRVVNTASNESVEQVSMGESDTSNLYVGFDTTIDQWAGACKWIATKSFTLTRVDIYGNRTGSTSTQLIDAALYLGDGTTPTTELGISTNSYDLDDISTSLDYIRFDFAPITITNTTEYWIAAWATGISTTKAFIARFNSTTGSSHIYISSAARESVTWAPKDLSASEIRCKLYGY